MSAGTDDHVHDGRSCSRPKAREKRKLSDDVTAISADRSSCASYALMPTTADAEPATTTTARQSKAARNDASSWRLHNCQLVDRLNCSTSPNSFSCGGVRGKRSLGVLRLPLSAQKAARGATERGIRTRLALLNECLISCPTVQLHFMSVMLGRISCCACRSGFASPNAYQRT